MVLIPDDGRDPGERADRGTVEVPLPQRKNVSGDDKTKCYMNSTM